MADKPAPPAEPGSPERLSEVEERLGYRFRDRALLETALTHRSYAHERGEDVHRNYERLEFLGDATLGLVVSEWLYGQDEDAPEGVLSRRRQSIVRTSTLARAADGLELGRAIRLGRGEERTGGRAKASLLADVFEAVVGAIHLDGGIRSARAFLRRRLARALSEAGRSSLTADDFKTRLQELFQARLQRTPHYRIVSTTGPDHALEFEVEVLLDERVLARGVGANRKCAEQEAARRALESIETNAE